MSTIPNSRLKFSQKCFGPQATKKKQKNAKLRNWKTAVTVTQCRGLAAPAFSRDRKGNIAGIVISSDPTPVTPSRVAAHALMQCVAAMGRNDFFFL
jgi:hypothetical protein